MITSNSHNEDSSDDEFPLDAGTGPQLELAKRENKAVLYLRVIVVILLVSVAVAVCATVFTVARNNEHDMFEESFADLGVKIADSFEGTLQLRLGLVEDFALQIAGIVEHDDNMTWPFVTFDDYEERAGYTARLADLMSLSFCPLVEDRESWNDYSRVNGAVWLAKGKSIQQNIPIEEVVVTKGFSPSIVRVGPNGFSPATDTGSFLPLWQTFPATEHAIVNVDLSTHPNFVDHYSALLESGKPVMPSSYDFLDPETGSKDPRRPMIYSFLETYEKSGVKYEDDPIVPVLYPVFDRVAGDDKKVVAVLFAGIYWKTYFRQILPAKSNGIHAVLSNTCGQTYTYEINGKQAHFMGHGDLHDLQYDELGVTSKLTRDLTRAATFGNTEPWMARQSACHYRLRVYPSHEFALSFHSSEPIVYTAALAAVFAFTSIFFLLYDFCVAKRQRIVMKSAVQSGTIVSSLFPVAVRDRMYQEQEDNEKNTKDSDDSKIAPGGQGGKQSPAAAIANLYPECTVLFADLAGFTSWSSLRNPAQVFDLLETIYGAFDYVAKRLKVFKIETIGDCYVAVTGLPEAQPRHAVIMAKFAQECISCMRVLVQGELTERLGGDDTAKLAVRVGFHSGPVTAGVLRGEKSRFQIFGDTVNTAARMESTGIPGRIQVSPTTADLLIRQGKSTWLTPRETLVSAKGKGTMQTYWVNSTNTAPSEESDAISASSDPSE